MAVAVLLQHLFNVQLRPKGGETYGFCPHLHTPCEWQAFLFLHQFQSWPHHWRSDSAGARGLGRGTGVQLYTQDSLMMPRTVLITMAWLAPTTVATILHIPKQRQGPGLLPLLHPLFSYATAYGLGWGQLVELNLRKVEVNLIGWRTWMTICRESYNSKKKKKCGGGEGGH